MLRHSVRSFDGSGISDEAKRHLGEFATRALAYYNANDSRIAIIDSDESSAPSTYGFIGGCRSYMVLVSSGHCRHSRTRAAAAMELCVLEATRLGLGTCWIGSTFKRSSFSDACSLGEGEEILAIVPCGTAAKPRLRDRLMTAVARSHSRKAPSDLFFEHNLSSPLAATSPLYDKLEYLRLAPSSTNSQPWRVIALDQQAFDLCSATDNRYTDLDMGIAMAHISVAFSPSEVDFADCEATYPRLISFARCVIAVKK